MARARAIVVPGTMMEEGVCAVEGERGGTDETATVEAALMSK